MEANLSDNNYVNTNCLHVAILIETKLNYDKIQLPFVDAGGQSW